METFSDKTKNFLQHISDKVREIHRKKLKIEDFCANSHKYKGTCMQILLECNWKGSGAISYKTEDLPLTYVW